MISCTEFIPLYSEFFKYLDKRGGHDAVMQYWYYISDYSIGDKTNPNSLASFIERDGPFLGAVHYWDHTLTEEACDLVKIVDEKNQVMWDHMRHCPSRGMLNALQHVEPYYDYCGHCNVIYARVLNKYGMEYEMDHSCIANAECESLLYRTGHKPEREEYLKTEGKRVVDMKAEDNKYLHRDFHLLGDLALTYCGQQFGEEAVTGFLRTYAEGYYAPQIEEFKKNGLPAVKAWFEKIYEIEEASEVLSTELTEDRLTVTIAKCPVIEYMHSLGQKPGKYYIQETTTLYSAIAEYSGLGFEMDYYNEDGATRFNFVNKN